MKPKLYLQKRSDSTYRLHLELMLRRGYDMASIVHRTLHPEDTPQGICREVVINLHRIPYTSHKSPLEAAIPIGIKEKAEGCAVRIKVKVIPREDEQNPEKQLFEDIINLREIIEIREKTTMKPVRGNTWTRTRGFTSTRSLDPNPKGKGKNSYIDDENWS